MPRELSAGGVAVRRMRGAWWFAAIEPGGRPGVLALPKGLIAPDDSGEATALREIAEETGIEGTSLGKLGDIRYVYTWEGERVFKVVSFFLVRYRRGRIGELPQEHAHEVAEAKWLPFPDVLDLLTYKSERDMAFEAFSRL